MTIATGMGGTSRRAGRGIPVLLLGLVLALRLMMAPGLLAPPQAGLVPICMGAEIVYVALDDGQISAPEVPLSDPCPFFGFATLHEAPVPAALPVPFPRGPRLLVEAPAPAPSGRAPAPYAARAPPVLTA